VSNWVSESERPRRSARVDANEISALDPLLMDKLTIDIKKLERAAEETAQSDEQSGAEQEGSR
jgi:hypothetical protein